MYVLPHPKLRTMPRASAPGQLFVLLLGLLLAAALATYAAPAPRAQEGENGACCPQFTPTPTRLYSRRVEAESYSSKVGNLRLGTTADPLGGGQELQYVEYGNYAVYSGVNLGAGLTRVELRGASPSGGQVSFRLGSATTTPACVISWVPTSGSSSYASQSASCSGLPSGYQTVYVTFEISGLNTNSFTFVTR